MFRRLYKEVGNKVPAIQALLERLNIVDKGSIHDAVIEWAEHRAKSDSPVLSVASGLLTCLLNRNRIEFKHAVAEAGHVLVGKRVVILIDNPEDYALRKNEDGANDVVAGIFHNKRALLLFRSLTFAAATFQPKEARISVKYFVPTEVYRFLSRESINWGKIRGSIHALRWEPDELLCMIAKRIRFYRFRCGLLKTETINLAELDSVEHAYKEWLCAFDELTVNSVIGANEYSWHYVLRHTQLMPRQIIACGNRIFEKAAKQLPISLHYIKDGIDSSETDNAKDSLGIFEQIHGHILEFCEERLGDIQARISHEDLEKNIYPVLALELDRIFAIKDFSRFRRFLSELGIIGRAMPRYDTDLYYCALFEDEVDDILRIERKDTLFVHPMFLRHLAIDRKQEVLRKAVSTKSAISCMDFLNKPDRISQKSA